MMSAEAMGFCPWPLTSLSKQQSYEIADDENQEHQDGANIRVANEFQRGASGAMVTPESAAKRRTMIRVMIPRPRAAAAIQSTAATPKSWAKVFSSSGSAPEMRSAAVAAKVS